MAAKSKLDMVLNLKQKLSRPVSKVRGKLSRLDQKAVRSQEKVNKLGVSFESLKRVAVGALGGIAVAGFGRMLDKVGQAQNDVAQLMDVSSMVRKQITQDAVAIGDAYQVNVHDTIKATDALTDQLGGSHKENMKIVEEGLKRAGGSGGELLQQIQEYPSALQQMGLNAEQAVGIMTQSIQEGVFSDKGIDAIKEAGIQLREMPKPTREAIENLGLSSSAIQQRIQSGASSMFEEVQNISKQINGLKDNSPAVGQALADIFKGPGEDAAGFVKALGDMNGSINDVKDNTMGYIQQKRELLKLFSQFKVMVFQNIVPALLSFANFLQENKGIIKTLIPVVAGLSAALGVYYGWLLIVTGTTKLLTAVTAAYNAVLAASPLGWIAAAIGLVVGALTLLYNKFESVRRITWGVWGAMKQVFSNVVDTVTKLPKMIFKSLEAVPKAIFNLFSGVGEFFSALFSGNFQKIPGIIKGIGESLIKANPVANLAIKVGSELGKGVGKSFNKEFSQEVNKGQEKAQQAGKGKADSLVQRSTSGEESGATDQAGGDGDEGADTSKVVGGGAKKKILNVSIDSVNAAQGDFNINTTNLQEGTQEVSKQLEEALIRAIRNFENSV